MPLNELTHLNFAFAFITTDTYELTTMDSLTSESLWKLTTDTKRYNPDLKVYVAVGGWTFSDNGTATQPLFSEISRTEANRQKFADNCLRFLNQYSFDGYVGILLTLRAVLSLTGSFGVELTLIGSTPARLIAVANLTMLKTLYF